MNEKFEEQTTIFISIVKWIVLAAIIGILVGASTTLFLKLLGFATGFTAGIPYYYVILPITFVLCTFIINHLAPQSKGHGTEKVIEAVHKRSGKMQVNVIPVKLLTTIMDKVLRARYTAHVTTLLSYITGGTFECIFKQIHRERFRLYCEERAAAKQSFFRTYCNRHTVAAADTTNSGSGSGGTALTTDDANSLLNRIAQSEYSSALVSYFDATCTATGIG